MRKLKPRPAIANVTTISIRVKPAICERSARLFDNGHSPRQPVDSNPPRLITSNDRDASSAAASVGVENDVAGSVGHKLVRTRQQFKLYIVRQRLRRHMAPTVASPSQIDRPLH